MADISGYFYFTESIDQLLVLGSRKQWNWVVKPKNVVSAVGCKQKQAKYAFYRKHRHFRQSYEQPADKRHDWRRFSTRHFDFIWQQAWWQIFAAIERLEAIGNFKVVQHESEIAETRHFRRLGIIRDFASWSKQNFIHQPRGFCTSSKPNQPG